MPCLAQDTCYEFMEALDSTGDAAAEVLATSNGPKTRAALRVYFASVDGLISGAFQRLTEFTSREIRIARAEGRDPVCPLDSEAQKALVAEILTWLDIAAATLRQHCEQAKPLTAEQADLLRREAEWSRDKTKATLRNRAEMFCLDFATDVACLATESRPASEETETFPEHDPPTAEPDGSANRLGAVERALAVMLSHPEWSVTRIAKEAGANRQSLYKSQRFLDALKVKKTLKAMQRPPRGAKDSNGRVEVYEDD